MTPERDRELRLLNLVDMPAEDFGNTANHVRECFEEIDRLRESLRQRDEQIDILAHEVEDRADSHARLVDAVREFLGNIDPGQEHLECCDSYRAYVDGVHGVCTCGYSDLREALKEEA